LAREKILWAWIARPEAALGYHVNNQKKKRQPMSTMYHFIFFVC
jgi:hypothetical protein